MQILCSSVSLSPVPRPAAHSSIRVPSLQVQTTLRGSGLWNCSSSHFGEEILSPRTPTGFPPQQKQKVGNPSCFRLALVPAKGEESSLLLPTEPLRARKKRRHSVSCYCRILVGPLCSQEGSLLRLGPYTINADKGFPTIQNFQPNKIDQSGNCGHEIHLLCTQNPSPTCSFCSRENSWPVGVNGSGSVTQVISLAAKRRASMRGFFSFYLSRSRSKYEPRRSRRCEGARNSEEVQLVERVPFPARGGIGALRPGFSSEAGFPPRAIPVGKGNMQRGKRRHVSI